MMIINGIDFDKRLDNAKKFNEKYIDCMFQIQNIMDSEPKFGSPLDFVVRAVGVAVTLEDFKMRILSPSAEIHFPASGTVHRGELIMIP